MNTTHYTISIQDSINDYQEVQGGYFDACSEDLASAYFRDTVPWSKYFGDRRYQITMKANPIMLQYPD